MAWTADEMVIDQSDRLHQGIDDGRADKAEAEAFEFFRECDSGRCVGGNLIHALPAVDDGVTIDALPQQRVERVARLVQSAGGAGVGDGRCDFETVADDAGVGQQARDISVAIAGYPCGIEVVECLAVVFALLQYCDPRQPGLGTFQHDEFE